jgi:hypothetical protein
MLKHLLSDSAFAFNQHKNLIKSGADEMAQDFEEHIILEEATSMCQTAEWGMNGFQLSFPHLRDHLCCEEFGECKVIISLVVHLFNIWSHRLVGINEILLASMRFKARTCQTFLSKCILIMEDSLVCMNRSIGIY